MLSNPRGRISLSLHQRNNSEPITRIFKVYILLHFVKQGFRDEDRSIPFLNLKVYRYITVFYIVVHYLIKKLLHVRLYKPMVS